MAIYEPQIDAARAPRRAPQTFAEEADRVRLSRAGLEAARRVAAAWDLLNAEAAALLGVSATTWDRIKGKTFRGALNQDQLTRLSAVIGIFKGLHLLFADAISDRWPRLPNEGPIFRGKTPVGAMVEGGIPVMLEVRRYIDATRGGL